MVFIILIHSFIARNVNINYLCFMITLLLKITFSIFSALPEVKSFEIDEDWEFMVLACDGIWDVLTNQVKEMKITSVFSVCSVKYNFYFGVYF